MKRVIFIIFLLTLISSIFSQEKYSVLFLSSYESSFPTFQLQYEGLIESFEDLNDRSIELHMDFLDSKRFHYNDVKELKYQSLLYKVNHSRPFDYAIVSDDNALRFVLEYRQELFENTPIVFFGVNDVELALKQNDDPFITGFIEDISYSETLKSISELLPESEELYILYDSTTSGSADYNRIKEINEEKPLFNFHYLSLEELSFDELYNQISRLTVNQPILLLSAFNDKNDRNLSFYESIRLLTLKSGSPIFHLWGHGIGEGLIGGKVVDHKHYAKLSGRLVNELIAGADISSYKVSIENENRYLFDSEILKKFALSEKLLPSDSILIHKNRIFSDQALHFFILLTFIISLLTATIIIIYRMYKSKSKAECKIRALNLSLEKEKESLAITLRSIGDGVIATDQNCNITFINDVTTSLTGWILDEVYGCPLEDVFNIVHEYSNERCLNPAKIVKETGKIVELTNHTCLIAKNGIRYCIEDSAAPIKDHDGNLLGVIIVFRDTTEKIKLRESVINTQKLEALGVLAGGIAHDFNNYLGGVIGFVELAKLELTNTYNKKIDDYLCKILDVSDKAVSLTQQLLTFSKGGKPNREVCNLKEMIEHSAEFALSGSNIIANFTFDENLWNCNCDINQISQCIDNLVINAIQAMPNGGILSISANNEEKAPPELEQSPHILIRITDKGTGIPKKILDRIFDPFYTTKEKGHGLGLATVFSIINKHNGIIKVDSTVGSGSTFSVYLPAVATAVSPLSVKGGNEHSGSGEILILDDQKYILEILQEMLENLGYSVKPTRTSNEVLEIIRNDRAEGSTPKIKACILDQTIPGDLPGYKVASQIKQIAPDLPLIAASGYSDKYVLSNPEKYNFIASIQKPFSLSSLSNILEINLNNHNVTT